MLMQLQLYVLDVNTSKQKLTPIKEYKNKSYFFL